MILCYRCYSAALIGKGVAKKHSTNNINLASKKSDEIIELLLKRGNVKK